jgi:integrase
MFPYILPFWLEYIRARPDLAAWTKTTYARIAGHLRASGVEPVEGVVNLAPYVVQRKEAGISPRTLLLEVRVAAAAFRWAQRAGLVGISLRLEMPRIRVDGARFVLNHHTPTRLEALAMLRAMPRDDWQLAAQILAKTGARIGEVVSLRSEDLDDRTRTLTFGRAEGASKTGVRTVPIGGRLARALAGRSGRGEAPLLDLGGTEAPIQALERRILAACRTAGIPAFTPHGLRRLVVRSLLAANVDPKTAASLTGHSIVTMLRFYQEITDDDRREAIAQAHLDDLEEVSASETKSDGSRDPAEPGSLSEPESRGSRDLRHFDSNSEPDWSGSRDPRPSGSLCAGAGPGQPSPQQRRREPEGIRAKRR